VRHRPAVALAAAVVIAYAWWETGLHPFSWPAYAALAVPFAAVVTAYGVSGGLSWRRQAVTAHYRRAADGATWKASAPWLVLVLAVLALEAAGLALGGRSHTVPTLSDVVDRALAWHGVRVVVFLVWLALGVLPGLRLRAGAAAADAQPEKVV